MPQQPVGLGLPPKFDRLLGPRMILQYNESAFYLPLHEGDRITQDIPAFFPYGLRFGLDCQCNPISPGGINGRN